MDDCEVKCGGDNQAQLMERIVAAYPTLPPQMRKVARDIEQYASVIGIDRIQTIADRCAVPPSAIVRFARLFGYDGFREFREVFRAGVRAVSSGTELADRPWNRLLTKLVQYTNARLAAWQSKFDEDALARASKRLRHAGRVRIAATPNATAVACYAFYALLERGRTVELVTSLCPVGTLRHPDDVWLLICLQRPCPSLDEIASQLRSGDVPAVVIADSRACWSSTKNRDVLLVPGRGGLNLDGVIAAMTLCAAIVEQAGGAG